MVNLLIGINGNNVNVGEYIAGILMAVLFCAVIYVGIMALYIYTRKKRPSAKYWIELLFIGVGLIISFFIKLFILGDISNEEIQHDVWGYLAYSLSAIYSLVGSLQFEGLPFSFSQMPVLQTCLYFGSSIIAGLIVLSVITAKASYEIYSLISLHFSRAVDVFARKNSIYVFTSLTKDSILLAENIKDNDKNAVIIFAGNNIPSFSRKEALCREIMNNSFYYYSLSSGTDTKYSLFKRLRLKKSNVSLLSFDMESTNTPQVETSEVNQNVSNEENQKKISKRATQKRLCEFYFELDENKKPNQEGNTTDALKELECVMKETFVLKENDKLYNNLFKVLFSKIIDIYKEPREENVKPNYEPPLLSFFYEIAKHNRWCVTEHYILTFSESNYAYYDRQVNEKIDKFVLNNLKLLKSPFLNNLSCFKEVFDIDKEIQELEKLSFKDACLRIREHKNEKKDAFIKFLKDFERALVSFLKASNQVHIVNESYLSAISLVEERSKAIKEKALKEKKSDACDSLLGHLGYTENGCSDYKALILGFGGNGQSALNALYYDSAVIDKNFNFNGFYADVIDQNIHDLDGTFSKNHPLYRCFTTDNPIPMEKSETAYIQEENIIKNDEIKSVYEGKDLKNKFDMTFPIIQFHNKSCTSLEFINFFDSVTGDTATKAKNNYNIIVIAFGNDRTNINIANAIIDDIRRECFSHPHRKSDFMQVIAVNIRDRDNLNKLNWTEKDKRLWITHGIVVFSFGAKEDIYSYKKILDYRKQYEFSTNYELMQKIACDNKEIEELSEKLSASYNSTDTYGQNKSDDYNNLINRLLENRKSANENLVDRIVYQTSYLKLDVIKKEVNRISAVYGNVFSAVIKAFLKQQSGLKSISDPTKNQNYLSFDTIKALLKLEHEKWARFYVAHGYIYNETKDEDFKMHDSLIPMRFVKEDKYVYDLINVIRQWEQVINKKMINESSGKTQD